MGKRATHDAACCAAAGARLLLLVCCQLANGTPVPAVTSVRLAADGRTTASPCVLHTPTPTLQPDATW